MDPDSGQPLAVRDNPAKHRYEAIRGDELLGELQYRRQPGAVVLVHTEVLPEAEGTGVGSRLVSEALADIRNRGLRMVPVCPFVVEYLRRHPENNDLLATPEQQRAANRPSG